MMLLELKQWTLLVIFVAIYFIGSKVGVNAQERVSAANSVIEQSFPQLDLQDQEKRNWKQLQGSWGKRSDELDQYVSENTEDIIDKREKWAKLQGSWGKRAREEYPPWALKNIANMLIESPELIDSWETRPLKRAWAKFAGTWGKRPFVTRAISPRSTDWSSLRGSWGKRGNNWGKLRGGWGKRDSDK